MSGRWRGNPRMAAKQNKTKIKVKNKNKMIKIIKNNNNKINNKYNKYLIKLNK
jgi:hypothetical protein